MMQDTNLLTVQNNQDNKGGRFVNKSKERTCKYWNDC
jgi:hypothetical protein